MPSSHDHPNMPMIFDGHNDLLFRLYENSSQNTSSTAPQQFINGRDGHLDLPRCKKAGFGGGFFAIYVPDQVEDDLGNVLEEMRNPPYDLALPDAVSYSEALPIVMQQAAILLDLEASGALKICTTIHDLEDCMASGTIAAIMHMEGAEAVDPDLYTLDVLYAAGLRSLGPVWSRPTIFGHGVPFRYPSTGDTGDGLTDDGFRLVKRCDALGVMLDLSHLNEAGFWDIAKTSHNPLVATHSNAHALCPHARNLTDRQLAAIRDSGGMVGLNFAVAFLRPDGAMNEDTPISQMIQQLDYLIEHLGENHVGLGSDFDGAHIPNDIGDVQGLVPLREAMRAHGYNDALMTKLCHQNWIDLLRKILK